VDRAGWSSNNGKLAAFKADNRQRVSFPIIDWPGITAKAEWWPPTMTSRALERPEHHVVADTAERVLVPTIDGEWWQVAGNPDVGKHTTDDQQVVDFAVWQAADGSWQIWACIRLTSYPGFGRLFYRWEGAQLTERDWKPMGIAMTSETRLGETEGGLQAPYVLKDQNEYFMLYGTWTHIALAKSQDGKSFQRQLMPDQTVGMFSEGDLLANTRDPMVFRIGSLFYIYYTAHPFRSDEYSEDAARLIAEEKKRPDYEESRRRRIARYGEDFVRRSEQERVHRLGSVYVRTSTDLRHWSPSRRVALGGAAGTKGSSAECPFVYFHEASGYYYLFRTQRYGENGQTRVYRSKDPTNFGINDDRYLVETLPVAAPEIIEFDGQVYIAALLPTLKGIQIARLKWVPKS
jgi:hypothetical protein